MSVAAGLGDLDPDVQLEIELRIGGEYGGMSAQTARYILKVRLLASTSSNSDSESMNPDELQVANPCL